MGANKWWVEVGEGRVKLSKAFKMLTVVISNWEKHLGVNKWEQYVVLNHVFTWHRMNCLIIIKLVQHRHILSCIFISRWSMWGEKSSLQLCYCIFVPMSDNVIISNIQILQYVSCVVHCFVRSLMWPY